MSSEVEIFFGEEVEGEFVFIDFDEIDFGFGLA